MSIFDNVTSLAKGAVIGAAEQAVSGAVSGALSGVIGTSLGIPQLPFGGLPASIGGGLQTASGSTSPLSEFLVEIQSNGIAWSNRFYVRFVPPQKVLSDIKQFGAKQADLDPHLLTMRCDMAELPGYSFLTSDTRTMSPIYRTPQQISFTDLNLQFIMSADYAELYFFNYWMFSIKDQSNLFAYYNDIVTTIELTMFDQQNMPVYGVQFVNCWPMSTNPMQVAWQDQDYLRLGVTFAYEQWQPVVYDTNAHSTDLSERIGALSTSIGDTSGLLSGFASSILPSLPGGSKIASFTQMSTSQMLQVGTSILGVKNPTVSGVLSGAGSSLISGLFGG